MSARDVIRQIEALPISEQREIVDYVEKVLAAKAAESAPQAMTVDEAIDHVFKNYDGLLAKLAQ